MNKLTEPQLSHLIAVRIYGMVHIKVLLNFKTKRGDNIITIIIIRFDTQSEISELLLLLSLLMSP